VAVVVEEKKDAALMRHWRLVTQNIFHMLRFRPSQGGKESTGESLVVRLDQIILAVPRHAFAVICYQIYPLGMNLTRGTRDSK
jgi:hypothetical protein